MVITVKSKRNPLAKPDILAFLSAKNRALILEKNEGFTVFVFINLDPIKN